MATKEQQLDSMLRQERINELSQEQDEERDEVTSKSQFRKPIKNPFSDQEQSDSDLQRYPNQQSTGTPFPPRPPTGTKTALQQAQQQMKWDRTEQVQNQILSRLQGQGMKDKKIRQLASKYKALNIAYQKQKTQRKNLQNQLNSMMKTNEQVNKSSLTNTKLSKSIQKQKQKEKHASCSNCQQSEKKIMEFRVKNQNLKSEVNKLTRVLSRQLGQDFNIDQALNQQNGWKGRQQKIQKLKSRVKQLQEKLNNNGINISHMSGFTHNTHNTQVNNAFNGTRTSALLAQNKRKQLDNLKIQVDALKNQNQILQGKVKSLVSRKVILQNQLKQAKNQFEKKRQILIQKSDNDDKFIQLLKNQNQKLKKQQKVVTKVIYKQDNNAEVSQLKKQVQILRKKLKSASLSLQSNKNIHNVSQNQQQDSLQKQKKVKDLNSVSGNEGSKPPRVVSAQKKKRLEQQYVKGNKYLNKMSAQDEEQLYKNWKNGINKQ